MSPHAGVRAALALMLLTPTAHAIAAERCTPAALQWNQVPELVVLTSIMEYEAGGATEYRATSQRLTDDDVTSLVKDMTEALQLLTGGTLRAFASEQRETPVAGQRVSVMRPGKIVVARYRGVREQLDAVGWGGRSTKGTTIRAGAVILDSEFDRTSDTRRLLRMHELGHVLGYDHVDARPSIMNPRIGSEPTRFDIDEGRSAFHDFPVAARAQQVSGRCG